MHELSNGEIFFSPQVTSEGQRSNPKNFEVDYLQNGTR